MRHKNYFLILFVTLLFGIISLSACSDNTTERKLSEMEDRDLIQYLVNSGVSIPDNLDTDFVRGMIVELEDDPEHPAEVLGYTVVTDLYEEIRNIVKEYDED